LVTQQLTWQSAYMGFYSGRRVLVTGGTGFIGSNLAKALVVAGAKVRVTTRHAGHKRTGDAEVLNCDLIDPAQCLKAVRGTDMVFHLAAHGFGIGANVHAQPELFTRNAIMSVNILEAARQAGVQRFLLCSSSSVYDGAADVLDDTKPWTGDPHPSEFGFGWAKRTAEAQARVYAQHADMKIAIVRPSNPYGPMDLFDPQRSHVIPAMVLRALAREDPFTVWGTGKAQRSFVFVDDLVAGMMLALEKHAACDPLNLASPVRTPIAELARKVLAACGAADLKIKFDTTKPEGHPGRFPTTAKAMAAIGWQATTPLDEGISKTVRWYLTEGRAPPSPGGRGLG
jgi:GDP-L-fucose synthase